MCFTSLHKFIGLALTHASLSPHFSFKKYAKLLGESLYREFDPALLEVELVNDGTLDGKFDVVLENSGEVLYEHPQSVVVVDPQLTEMEQLVG